MIKIIERHDPKEFEPKYRFTCEKCRSVADITIDEIKQKGVQWDCYYEFECPVCNRSYSSSSSSGVLNRDVFKRLGE